MQIARPPSGFFIIERPIAVATIEGAVFQCPWAPRAYGNLKDRLKMAAHTIGHPVRGKITERVFIDLDPKTNEPRFAVAYKVLGDTVTICSVKILIE